MLKIGDKVYVRDPWIEYDYMVPQAEIIEIGYYINTESPKVCFIEFINGKKVWFPTIALKVE